MKPKVKWNELRKELRDKVRPGPPPSPAATDGGTPAPYNVVPLAVPGTAGIVACRVDSCGCPNRATHWLLDEDGRIRTPACQTHVELARARDVVALTFDEAKRVAFPYLGGPAPEPKPAASPRKRARKPVKKVNNKARKRVG